MHFYGVTILVCDMKCIKSKIFIVIQLFAFHEHIVLKKRSESFMLKLFETKISIF